MTALTVSFTTTGAEAQTIDDLQRKATEIAQELDRLSERASGLNEQQLDAEARLGDLRAELERLKASTAEAGTEVAKNRDQAAEYAVEAYTDAAIPTAAGVASNPYEVGISQVYLSALGVHREDAIEGLKAAISDMDDRTAEVRTTETQVNQELERQRQLREELTTTIASQESLQASVKGQLADAVAAEQARIEAERARAAEAAVRAEEARRADEAARLRPAPVVPDTNSGGNNNSGNNNNGNNNNGGNNNGGGTPAPERSTTTAAPARRDATTTTAAPQPGPGPSTTAAPTTTARQTTTTTARPAPAPAPKPEPQPDPAPAPAPNGGTAARIIAAAKTQLGRPYKWGGTSPSTGFDCSGFTSWAFRQAGVGLPRTSGAQYSSGRKVAVSELQPGDLIAYGSPVHHIGIYIGGGQYIHSPRTGDVVKIASIYSSGTPRPSRVL